MSDDDEITKRGAALAARLFAGAKRPPSPPPPARYKDYTFRHLFGEVWHAEDMSLQERSLITCAALIALNRTNEQQLHFVAARNLGIPREKIEGVIAHLAHYGGWPCAASANQVLNEVWPPEAT